MFSYGKLDDTNTITSIVQSDKRISDGVHVFLSADSSFVGDSYIGKKWDRPGVPWHTISRRQGRQQLILDGFDGQVQTIIDGIVDATEQKMTQAWYDQSNTWERDNAYLISLGEQLGLTATQMDDMFKAAIQL